MDLFQTLVRAGFVAIRSKLTASALALALISTTLPAAAGGLGRMHVQSGLGQPFRAEVDITGIRTQDLSKLKVSLAPPSAFAEMQMDYTEVLSSLKVSVSRKADGKLVARVQGSQPISDPFLFLLLELNDDGARTFKEFTALLEPAEGPLPALPVSAEQAKPAASPATTPAPAAPTPAPAAAAPTPAPAAAAASDKSAAAKPADNKPADNKAASTGKPAPASKPEDSKASTEPLPVASQHKVKPGETLSGVAARLKPADASLEQMMVGLYRNNSGAFSGNMDKLRAGETLDVPTAASVRAIPPAQALDTVRAQVKDWRNYVLRSADAASASAAQPPSQGKTAPADASAEVAPADSKQDVLKLSKVEGKAAEPQERAAQLEEELVTREKQLKEAGDRIGVLETQLEEMRSLLALRSQAGAQAQQQAEAGEAAAAGGEQSAKPAPAPSSQGSSSNDSMVLVGGLSAAAILAAGLAYAHRRQDALKAFLASLLARRQRKPKEAAAEADDAAPASVTAAVASDASEEDPLQVADRLIEYGKLPQAETVLMAALQKTPDRHELRLKLLKVYYATPLVDKFNAQAARLLDAVSKTSPLWLQALEMGRALDPNHPLYAVPAASAPVDDAVDFGFDEPDPLPPPVAAPAPVEAAKPAAAAPAPAPAEADPFGMDGDDFLLPDDAVMQGGGSFTPDASDIEQEEKPLLNYDFQPDGKGKKAEEVKAPPPPPPPPASEDFSMDEMFDFGNVGTAPAAVAPTVAEAAPAPAAAPAAIADPVADTLSQDDLDDLFAQPAPASAPAAAPEPAPVEEAEEELDIDALIAAEQAKQEAEAKAEKAARAAAAAEAAKRLHEDMALDFDGILEDTVPQVPALDLAALAAALEDAPSMDDLPPPDDTVLEAADMPLEMPDDGALAAELAEPIDDNAIDDNPLKDEMSEPAPPPAIPLSAPDLAFDFDAVFQDAIPAMTPSFDRGALAAALADAPSMEDLPDDELPHDDGPIVTPEQVDTKLDLAKVYIDMGDQDGAREILAEVLSEGTDTQRDAAMRLLEKL